MYTLGFDILQKMLFQKKIYLSPPSEEGRTNNIKRQNVKI